MSRVIKNLYTFTSDNNFNVALQIFRQNHEKWRFLVKFAEDIKILADSRTAKSFTKDH